MGNIFGILCFVISRKVKRQVKHRKKICAVYGEGAVTAQMCQRWFVKFCAGHTFWGEVDICSYTIYT